MDFVLIAALAAWLFFSGYLLGRRSVLRITVQPAPVHLLIVRTLPQQGPVEGDEWKWGIRE